MNIAKAFGALASGLFVVAIDVCLFFLCKIDSALPRLKLLSSQGAANLLALERKHVVIADSCNDVAKLARVLAGLAALGAWLTAPTGLAAVGVAGGIIAAPFLVLAAPAIIILAGAAACLAATTSLYSKWRQRSVGKS